jgi:hypothetical protein
VAAIKQLPYRSSRPLRAPNVDYKFKRLPYCVPDRFSITSASPLAFNHRSFVASSIALATSVLSLALCFFRLFCTNLQTGFLHRSSASGQWTSSTSPGVSAPRVIRLVANTLVRFLRISKRRSFSTSRLVCQSLQSRCLVTIAQTASWPSLLVFCPS